MSSAVRASSAAPKYVPKKTTRKSPKKKGTAKKKTNTRRRPRKLSPAQIRKQQKEHKKNIVLLFLYCALVSIICLIYIYFQSEVNAKMRRISRLEQQILELSESNETRLRKLQICDLADIKEKAIALGMHPVYEDQIIYYTLDKENFFDQYEDIPVQ